MLPIIQPNGLLDTFSLQYADPDIITVVFTTSAIQLFRRDYFLHEFAGFLFGVTPTGEHDEMNIVIQKRFHHLPGE